jgi:hypothetical protein
MAMGISEVPGPLLRRPSKSQPSASGRDVSIIANPKGASLEIKSRASEEDWAYEISMSVEASKDTTIRWMLGLSSTSRRRGMGTSIAKEY